MCECAEVNVFWVFFTKLRSKPIEFVRKVSSGPRYDEKIRLVVPPEQSEKKSSKFLHSRNVSCHISLRLHIYMPTIKLTVNPFCSEPQHGTKLGLSFYYVRRKIFERNHFSHFIFLLSP